MPLNPVKVALAVQGGLAAVCAMCEHYWDAQDRGEDWCNKVCGGPMAGGAFDKYKGPITDFSQCCFACGDEPTHAVRAKNNVRVLGACRKHVDLINKYKPADRPAVTVIMMSKDGTTSSDEMPSTPEKIKLVLGNE